MQLFSRNKAIVALALSALALGACGDDVTVPVAPAAPTTLSITPPSATMNVGEAVNFAVQISNSASTLASCTSSSATVATATVSGSSCRVTAIGAGNATITAAASTGQSAAASVSVVAPAPAITALAVSPSAAQLAVGSSLTVVPTVNRANSTVAVVYTYASSAASVATVSATGMVTAVAPGTTTITVTAAGTGTGFAAATMTSAATITVSDRAPGLTSLQVSPATAALTVGGTQSVTASAQGPRAAAATMTYGTSAPAIATVSATGVITAVAAGTATITVTAQSTQDGAFAASSLTGLVTVTVSNPAVVSINISALTQGPTTTSYESVSGRTGIVSAANGQVGQAIDINNTRDQIQMTATLATNGQRVDSVVAYVANADGTNRTSVGRQSYASGGPSGDVSLYINTADFTADFTAGTAAVKFTNGQKQISVSAFSGTTERVSTNSQTVNFNNVDGYASSATAPATTATNSAGQVWFGGADSLTARLGSATIVPVFYTAGRTLANITLSMRQGAGGETQACSTVRSNLTARPFKAVYGGAKAVAGDTTLVNCSTLESSADHIIGVSAATDNNGSAAPTTSWAGGFRTSTTVAAPVARRLDYVAPTVAAIRAKTSWPGDSTSTWVNGSFSFNDSTVASTDAGVGFAGSTSKGGRTWQYSGCGVLSTAPATFSGTTSDLAECSTSNSASAYSIKFVDQDMLGNSATSASVSVGVDKTNPLITWAEADSVTSASAVTFTPSVFDAKSSIADSGSVGGFVAKFVNAGTSYSAPSGRSCTNSAGSYANTSTVTYWTIASSGLSCTVSSTYRAKLYESSGPLGAANSSGYRQFVAYTSSTNNAFVYSVTAHDKAGNSVTSTHRALVDGSVPTVVVGQASAFAIAANPTFNVTYTDLRAATTWVGLTYGSTMLRYPANTINASAFGPTFSLTAGSSYSGTTATAITAPTFVASVPTPTPFIIGTTASTGASGLGLLATVTSNVLDFMGNTAASNATDAISSAALPSASVLTTTDGTLTVLQTLAAQDGGAAGLKAQFTGSSGTAVNPFSRVDFYRYTAANQYDYLGSSSAAPAATTTAGALALYTFNIGTYAAVSPTGVATTAAVAGDEIIAIGVRSNGLGTKSSSTIIGGAYLTVNITGLPAGVSVPVLVTGPNGFSSTVSVGNSSATKVPANGDGVYTATYPNLSPASGGVYTPASATNSATVVGNGAFALAANAYTLSAIQASVTVASLPTGKTTSLVFSLAGQNSVTFTGVANGTSTYTLPTAGTWTITPTDSVTSLGVPTTGLKYGVSPTTTTVAAAIGSSAVAAGSTLTYAIGTPHVTVTASVPAGITLTPSFTFRAPNNSADSTKANKTFASMTAGSSVATATNKVTFGYGAGSQTVIANPVLVGSTTYGVPVATVSQATIPSTAGFTTSALSTFAYNSARVAIVFSDSTGFTGGLADLANYPIAISLTNGSVATALGTFAPVANTSAINSAAPTAGVVLAASALLGPVAIPTLTIGTDSYSFSFTSATGGARLYDYDVNAKVITVMIKKN